MSAQSAQVIPFPAERRRATRLVPMTELVKRFHYSERWWRYRIAEGLPVHRWSARGLRFDVDEVSKWLEERAENG